VVGFCNKRLQFGMLHGSIAYLRVTAFYGFVKDGTFSDSIGALNAALDQVFSNTASWKGLVIDVRQNHGGDDALGIALAARLTKSSYLAYKKAALENDGKHQHFTPPQAVEVVPTSRPSFRGTVILLTGPDTVSAGETLAMALMGREPHVMRIGLNTQGVFSDVLNRSLPNGWRFRLPNEVYYTANGKSFDGAGVPPDIAVPFFSTEDMEAGRDTALEKTIQVIAQPGGQ
jgi:C-terminal processing protease CtpA/Prc